VTALRLHVDCIQSCLSSRSVRRIVSLATTLRTSDRDSPTSEGALSSLHDGTRVAPVCDRSVAWGDSICGRRQRRDVALACSMIASLQPKPC